MDDQACQHGYLHCNTCLEAANERARAVARFYEAEQKRLDAHNRKIEGRAAAKQIRFDPGPYGSNPKLGDFQQQFKRCACGSRLKADDAVDRGTCHYCHTGVPRPWVDRCKCGTGLMSAASINSGKCSDCRNTEYAYG